MSNHVVLPFIAVMLVLSFSWYLLMPSSESGMEVLKRDKFSQRPMCDQPNPFVHILKSGVLKHKDEIFTLDELTLHLEKDLARLTSYRITALADEGTPSKHVVQLSDRLKQHFPDVDLVWGVE